jgi:hypothetical protein
MQVAQDTVTSVQGQRIPWLAEGTLLRVTWFSYRCRWLFYRSADIRPTALPPVGAGEIVRAYRRTLKAHGYRGIREDSFFHHEIIFSFMIQCTGSERMWWRFCKSACPRVASTERTSMKFGIRWSAHTKICLEIQFWRILFQHDTCFVSCFMFFRKNNIVQK